MHRQGQENQPNSATKTYTTNMVEIDVDAFILQHFQARSVPDVELGDQEAPKFSMPTPSPHWQTMASNSSQHSPRSSSSSSSYCSSHNNNNTNYNPRSPQSTPSLTQPVAINMRGSITKGLDVNFKNVELPHDVYSIGYLAPRYSWPFFYSFLVFAIQGSILWLTFIDLTKDHPKHRDKNYWNVPREVSTEVFVAQYLALLVAVLSQDDVTTSLFFISVGVGPRYPEFQARLQTKYPGKGSATFFRYWITNLLRFTEGLVTILVSFVFIIQSDTVLDIFLNFAAVQFVADLDNLGFRLAVEGWVGVTTQVLAKQVLQEKIPIRKCKGYIDYFNQILLFLLVAVLFSMNAVTVRHQLTGNYIERDACRVVNVKFGGGEVYKFPPNTTFATTTPPTSHSDENNQSRTWQQLAHSERWILSPVMNHPPDLQFAYFSGHYQAEFKDKAGIDHKRPVYYEASRIPLDNNNMDQYRKDASVGMFYFCKNESAWVWTVRAFVEAGVVPQATRDRCEHGWLMRSPVTDAVVLEEAPMEGWKVWTGSLADASGLSISCLECNEDMDCGLTGGTCGKDNLCVCHNGSVGDFCTERHPCQQVIRFTEEGEYGIYNLDSSFSYGRPAYTLDGQLDTLDDHGIDEGSIGILQFTGRQWVGWVIPKDVAPSGRGGINADQHAYWSEAYFDSSKYEHYYSEPTNQFLPTGSLQWYMADETRSEGDYGPRGREIQVRHRYSCWALDCGSSAGLCGKYGECLQDEVLTFRNNPTIFKGGKCVCRVGYYGHFCEFKSPDDEL